MEEIYLLNSIRLEKLKPAQCRHCQKMFVVVQIHHVAEQSGNEHHHEATLDDADDSERLFCPYCGAKLGPHPSQPIGR